MLGAILLVGLGIATGGLLDDDSERTGYLEPQAQVEQSVRAGRQQIDRLRVELEEAERRSAGLARNNARIRRDVHRLRRSVRRRKPKR